MLMAFIGAKEYSWVVGALVFTWGMMDSSMATHCYSAIGKEFNDSPFGYAIYNFFQSLAVLTFQVFNIFVSDWAEFTVHSYLVLTLGLLFFAVAGFMPSSFAKGDKKEEESQSASKELEDTR